VTRIEAVLDRLLEDRDAHVLGTPAGAADLEAVESAFGRRLPQDVRLLLTRLGGGLLYDRHEVFGALRVMIHDIELVPDMVSAARRGRASGWPPERIPIHRAGSTVHLLVCENGCGSSRVEAAGGGASYADLAAFLEAVIVPPAA
jgi:hypothetical protein